ncbi:hypothetical protein TX23_01240 [Pseudomonas paralactis]|uniref:Uncharacterized protein n=1 Tax=Pseudomonas paralactis TaxID=1615673 RepID=A0A0R3ANH1_9PSED|nr:hypothetical protein [Pseudomonas paralactis]KRP74839.1 hypothetical protein TX23_01240 [Pseudomonas paralactis]
MTKYQVKSAGEVHEVLAVTFTQGEDLRLIGEGGAVVAIFGAFDWLKVVPVVTAPVVEDDPSTDKPALVGGQ